MNGSREPTSERFQAGRHRSRVRKNDRTQSALILGAARDRLGKEVDVRISLRSVVLFVTALAVYCGLAFAAPAYVSLPGLTVVTALLPGFVVGGIVHQRGMARAFWIGCATAGFVPYIITTYLSVSMAINYFYGEVSDFDEPAMGIRFTFAACHAMVLLNGIIVVLTKWLYAPREEW